MRIWLLLEPWLLFVGVPLGFDRLLRRGYQRLLFPGLWALALGALALLAREPGFDARQLLVLPRAALDWVFMGVRSALSVAALALAARRLGCPPPSLPLRVRALIFVLYPLLSVVPQGLLWRVFFVQRYAPLLGSGSGMLVASALAFAFAHVIFRNPVAIAATLIGGLCFSHAYLTTGSMLLADLEHAIDGLAVFSLGLGRYLYLGAARRTPG